MEGIGLVGVNGLQFGPRMSTGGGVWMWRVCRWVRTAGWISWCCGSRTGIAGAMSTDWTSQSSLSEEGYSSVGSDGVG